MQDNLIDLNVQLYCKNYHNLSDICTILKNMPINELHDWYYSIVDILIFNKKHLYTFEKYECFDEIFGNIIIILEPFRFFKDSF
jgi:hypothetical protein